MGYGYDAWPSAPALIIAAALGIAFTAAGTASVCAQAGSTGGTIGNTNKSISGGEEPPPQGAPQPAREPKRGTRESHEGAPSSGSKTYENPTINGVRVNWCLNSAMAGCGQEAASILCRNKGLSRAIAYKWEVADAAYYLGDHTLCHGFCGVFTHVTCE